MYALQMLALMRADEFEREARARRQRHDWADARAAGDRRGLRDRLTSWSSRADMRDDTAGSRVSGVGRPIQAGCTTAPACATC